MESNPSPTTKATTTKKPRIDDLLTTDADPIYVREKPGTVGQGTAASALQRISRNVPPPLAAGASSTSKWLGVVVSGLGKTVKDMGSAEKTSPTETKPVSSVGSGGTKVEGQVLNWAAVKSEHGSVGYEASGELLVDELRLGRMYELPKEAGEGFERKQTPKTPPKAFVYEHEEAVEGGVPGLGFGLRTQQLWSKPLPHSSVNAMSVGISETPTVFGDGCVIVLGSGTGQVKALNSAQDPGTTFETKGANITALCVHRLFPHSTLDIITCDARGSLTITHKQQILTKHDLGTPLLCLTIHTNLLGETEIVVGDQLGAVTAFTATDRLWKVQLGGIMVVDHPNPLSPRRDVIRSVVSPVLSTSSQSPDGRLRQRYSPSIRCMLSANLEDKYGGMCQGRFWNRDPARSLGEKEDETASASEGFIKGNQIVLAGEDGNVYIMDHFEIFLYAETEYTLTRVCGVPLPQSGLQQRQTQGEYRRRDGMDNFSPSNVSAAVSEDVQYLLVAGQFCGVHVYKNGKLHHTIETDEWVHDIATGDTDRDGDPEIILSELNSTIQVHKLFGNGYGDVMRHNHHRESTGQSQPRPTENGDEHFDHRRATSDGTMSLFDGDGVLGLYESPATLSPSLFNESGVGLTGGITSTGVGAAGVGMNIDTQDAPDEDEEGEITDDEGMML
ncbi:hypothetical protein HK102_005720 [Quaeritorhiza haematococci]|nr:hypothetical protein HK102_005720 [Quaeritorhiza haematococci]